jgi:hypothetical protein
MSFASVGMGAFSLAIVHQNEYQHSAIRYIEHIMQGVESSSSSTISAVGFHEWRKVCVTCPGLADRRMSHRRTWWLSQPPVGSWVPLERDQRGACMRRRRRDTSRIRLRRACRTRAAQAIPLTR